eukprot:jgi/Ulvmu1/9635/UM054_0067.1
MSDIFQACRWVRSTDQSCPSVSACQSAEHCFDLDHGSRWIHGQIEMMIQIVCRCLARPGQPLRADRDRSMAEMALSSLSSASGCFICGGPYEYSTTDSCVDAWPD